MALQKVFVAKGALAIFVWADVISTAEVGYIVVRTEGFFLEGMS